jgi:hypothetical protein
VNEISITIQLDIHASGDALTGRATAQNAATGGREPVEFNSWIGLVAAIDSLVESAKQSGSSVTPTS